MAQVIPPAATPKLIVDESDVIGENRSSMKVRHDPYSVALVCDSHAGLLSRILDIYRFFQNPPSVVLVSRARHIDDEPRPCVNLVTVPVPVVGLDRGDLSSVFFAVVSATTYLLYSFITYLRTCRAKSIRLVHAHFILPQGLFALLLARLLRVPLIITAQGGDVNSVMRSALLRKISLLVLRNANAIIAVSRPLQRSLQEFGLSNCRYLPNSVDTSAIRESGSSAGDVILFVGNLTSNKRPMLLIHAFEKVANKISTAKLLMCGEGPLRESIKKEIMKRGLGDRVTMLGYLSPLLLEELRSKAGIYVLPSRSEGLSLALLEAMAAGKTVIASRNESHMAILQHGENSLLFDLDDADDLAGQLLLAIGDEVLRSRLSQSARYLCESEFSNRKAAAKLEDLYSQAISTSRVR